MEFLWEKLLAHWGCLGGHSVSLGHLWALCNHGMVQLEGTSRHIQSRGQGLLPVSQALPGWNCSFSHFPFAPRVLMAINNPAECQGVPSAPQETCH